MSALGAKLFPSLHGYEHKWLRPDLVAALTLWAVLVPEALAYAPIAGVSPVVGLYAVPGALIVYAALGSSRELVVGPSAAAAALSAATVGEVAAGSSEEFVQLTVALALCVGAAALIAGLLRLGFVASLISVPVFRGLIIGLALTIIVGQVPALLGIDDGDGNFFEKLADLISGLGSVHALTLAVGGGSLVVLLALRRYLSAVPGALVVVVLSIVLVKVFNLGEHGLAIIGNIDSGLPSFGLPDASADVTAARMLRDLNEQLGRNGVRLLVARDVGQSRDVLRRAVPDAKFDATYPSVDAAVKAAGRADT